jgi:hypothetical protein
MFLPFFRAATSIETSRGGRGTLHQLFDHARLPRDDTSRAYRDSNVELTVRRMEFANRARVCCNVAAQIAIAPTMKRTMRDTMRALDGRLLAMLVASVGCGAAPSEESPAGHNQELSWHVRPEPAHKLIAWAALPQSERTPGPTSGQFATAANGVVPPFLNEQPIPGWSGLLANRDGTFIGMPDNGFGAKGNSADYVLGYYHVNADFKTGSDGTTNPGVVTNERFTAFNDRRGLLKNGRGVELTITADLDNYRSGAGIGSDSGIAVDARIKSQRLLTGYDFDIESIARAKDGSFWVGEEFGPYILHFAKDGTLLEEPAPHPFLKSPNHPDVLAGTATATLGSSRGFESLAYDEQQRFLYAVPEAAPTLDELRPVPGDERVLEIFEFDSQKRKYTGRSFMYRKDGPQVANNIVIGDMTNIDDDVYVLIERDSLFGAAAVVKRLYLVDLNVVDADGVLEKKLLVDLLDIDDPRDIGGDLPNLAPEKFNMPFDSIECVLKLAPRTLAVAIDTNFPGEDGRTPGVPDSTEFIKLRFERELEDYAPRRKRR